MLGVTEGLSMLGGKSVTSMPIVACWLVGVEVVLEKIRISV